MKIRKLWVILPVLAMVMSLLPMHMVQTKAEELDAGTYYKSLVQDIEDGKKQPSEFKSSNPKYQDPYGFGVDVPFYFAGQQELAVFRSQNYGQVTQFKSYDGLTVDKWNEKELLADALVNQTYSVPDNDSAFPLNYVKMTAFDPTGSGKDDHIAMIGVHYTSATDKGLYLIVYDNRGNNSGYLAVGQMTWIGGSSSTDLYNMMNSMSITAGDYDKDKKDTIVIYGAFDNEGMGLYEYTAADTANGVQVTKKNDTASKALLNPDASYTVTNGSQKVLNATVDTGDVNGDRIDDLIVSSYKSKPDGNVENERFPYIAVSLGGNNTSNIVNKKDAGLLVRKATSDANVYESMHVPGLSTGDINGDKSNEIVLGGIYYKYNVQSKQWNVDKNKLAITSLKVSKNSTSGAWTITENAFSTVDANAYTSDGLYMDDPCQSQTMVQCVAFDGPGNPEQIFINGFIYVYSGGEFSLASTNGSTANNQFFNEADNHLGKNGHTLTNTFFWSAAAGNFTGKDSSREQIVFVTCVKNEGQDNYHFFIGMIEGQNQNNSVVTNYYQYSNYNIWDEKYWPTTGRAEAKLEDNNALNFAICAVDNDNDGVILRYKGRNYAYADPEVMVVLQAAPYFSDVPYDPAGGTTSYSLTETYSFEEGQSTSTSSSFAVVGSVETSVCDVEMKAGYSTEWTEEFTQGMSQSQSYTWTAAGEDQVVVNRTPFLLFTYEILKVDPETGEEIWDPDNAMVISVPCVTTYEIMSVDKYNEFVEVYNQNLTAKAKKQGVPTNKVPYLDTLKDPYLQHEGQPERYRQVTADNLQEDVIVQPTALGFGVGESSQEYSFEEGTSSSHSTSRSHGFTFELSVTFGFEVFGQDAKAGLSTALETTQEHSIATSVEKTSGCSVSIQNMSAGALSEGGLDPNFVAQYYGFNYQMGIWDSNLDSTATTGSKKVPIVGYVISDLRRPNDPGLTGPKTITLTEGYEAQTIIGYNPTADPTPTVTRTAGTDKVTYDAATRTICIAEGLKAGRYPVKFTLSNGNPYVDESFNFLVTVVKKAEAAAYALADEIRQLSSDPFVYRNSQEARDQAKGIKQRVDALSAEEKALLSDADNEKLNTILAIITEIEENMPDPNATDIEKLLYERNAYEKWRLQYQDEFGPLSDEHNVPDEESRERAKAAFDQRIGEFKDLLDAYKALSFQQLYLEADNHAALQRDELMMVLGDFNTAYRNYKLFTEGEEAITQEKMEEVQEARALENREEALRDKVEAFDLTTADIRGQYEALRQEAETLREDIVSFFKDHRLELLFTDRFFETAIMLGELYYQVELVPAQNADAVTAVEKLLKSLPDAEYVDRSDATAINEATAAYQALTEEQKAMIDPALVNQLTEVEAALAETLADPREIVDADVSISSQYYTGKPITPAIVVNYEGKTKPLTEDKDYKVMKYENNTEVGIATVLIAGIGNYKGRKTVFFAIEKQVPKNLKITLAKSAYTYDGKAKKPGVTIKNGDIVLKSGTDYSVTYSNNKKR